MNGPAFPTAIPHDDSKALSAERRRILNQRYRATRDDVRGEYDWQEGVGHGDA